MEIYRVRQRDINSWVSNPVIRESFHMTEVSAKVRADEISYYPRPDGTWADVEIDTVEVED